VDRVPAGPGLEPYLPALLVDPNDLGRCGERELFPLLL
jgi:hypothetical protein